MSGCYVSFLFGSASCGTVCAFAASYDGGMSLFVCCALSSPPVVATPLWLLCCRAPESLWENPDGRALPTEAGDVGQVAGTCGRYDEQTGPAADLAHF